MSSSHGMDYLTGRYCYDKVTFVHSCISERKKEQHSKSGKFVSVKEAQIRIKNAERLREMNKKASEEYRRKEEEKVQAVSTVSITNLWFQFSSFFFKLSITLLT